jgi:hypothetical protein
LDDERLVVATVATLADQVQLASFPAPVLFIIGRVIEVLEDLRVCRRSSPSSAGDSPSSAGDPIERAQNA